MVNSQRIDTDGKLKVPCPRISMNYVSFVGKRTRIVFLGEKMSHRKVVGIATTIYIETQLPMKLPLKGPKNDGSFCDTLF